MDNSNFEKIDWVQDTHNALEQCMREVLDNIERDFELTRCVLIVYDIACMAIQIGITMKY